MLSQVSYLGIVGVKSEKDTVKRVLSASIASGLAQEFNWNGMKCKKAFKNLELCKVIFGIVTFRIVFGLLWPSRKKLPVWLYFTSVVYSFFLLFTVCKCQISDGSQRNFQTCLVVSVI